MTVTDTIVTETKIPKKRGRPRKNPMNIVNNKSSEEKPADALSEHKMKGSGGSQIESAKSVDMKALREINGHTLERGANQQENGDIATMHDVINEVIVYC